MKECNPPQEKNYTSIKSNRTSLLASEIRKSIQKRIAANGSNIRFDPKKASYGIAKKYAVTVTRSKKWIFTGTGSKIGQELTINK